MGVIVAWPEADADEDEDAEHCENGALAEHAVHTTDEVAPATRL